MIWAILAAGVMQPEACATGCLAAGADWRIVVGRGGWTLRHEGREWPVAPGAWRDGVRGLDMSGSVDGKPLRMRATFARCRIQPDAPWSGESGYIALLRLHDGRVLRGCMAQGWVPPVRRAD